MSVNEEQVNQVKDKVKYGDIDSPFTRYLDVLGKVVNMSDDMLGGNINEDKLRDLFSETNLQNIENVAESRFMDAQTNIDVKKIGYENWQNYNEKTMDLLKDGKEDDGEALQNLQKFQANLQDRIQRVSDMYDSVKKVNKELASLSEGKSSLTVPRVGWEKELGKDLTQKLIDRRYLQDKFNTDRNQERSRGIKSNSNSSKGNSSTIDSQREANDTPEALTAYDDFSKGPAELKHIQNMLKEDIFRLKEEIESYKQKWMTDAELFSKISSSLKTELEKRENGVSFPTQQTNIEEEEPESEEEEDVERYKRKTREREESLVPDTDSRSDDDNSLGEEEDEEDDDGSSGSVSSYERDIENDEETNLIENELNDVKEENINQEEDSTGNDGLEVKDDRKNNIIVEESKKMEENEKEEAPIEGV